MRPDFPCLRTSSRRARPKVPRKNSALANSMGSQLLILEMHLAAGTHISALIAGNECQHGTRIEESESQDRHHLDCQYVLIHRSTRTQPSSPRCIPSRNVPGAN